VSIAPEDDGSGQNPAVYGGRIPLSSSAPTLKNVRMCAYNRAADQGKTGYSDMPQVHSTTAALKYALLSFIRPGPDGAYETTCEQAAKGLAEGDDRVDVTITASMPSEKLAGYLDAEQVFANLPDACALEEKLIFERTPGGAMSDGEWKCV